MTSANLNPNLFRLSLPEWLKEQVESGQHKGVFWINEEEKIFHVPWKHASRNGWEDGDVSLFKAWAIYTNRYREGIDKPKPALWKTNFRCAINSHNYITFMKDQGERKGDKAHRIMKLIEQPKDKNKVVENCTKYVEPHRKRVRITYPSSNEQSKKRVRSTYSNAMTETNGHEGLCDNCKNENSDDPNSCGYCKAINQLSVTANNTNAIKNNDHEYLTDQNKQHFIGDRSSLTDNTDSYKPRYDIKTKKPNLQDLYFVGKALQSIEDSTILCLKTKKQFDPSILKSYVDKIKKEDVTNENLSLIRSTESDNRKNNQDMISFNVNMTASEDDDELITPRETEKCSL